MPLDRLPSRIVRCINKSLGYDSRTIDLSNESLAELTMEEFQALGEYLAGKPEIKALILRNCKLAQVDVDKLSALFESLTCLEQLHSFDLSDNGLSYNPEQINIVFKVLSQLPGLNELAFMDRYWDEVDPLFFEQLKTLPFLRMYKKSVPNSASSSSDESTTSPFCFLNRVETDAFVDVIRMNRDVASCYLGPINDNQQFDRDNSPSEALQIVGISSRSRSAYNALLERYPAIGDLDKYRKQDFDYPTDLCHCERGLAGAREI